MASKRNQRRKSCTGKIRHLSRDHAQIHLFALRDKGNRRLHTYHCSFCNGWHVGHVPKKQLQRRNP